MPAPSKANVGNAGEALVLSELTIRGYHAALAPRNNPAYDILVRYSKERYAAVRVKSAAGTEFRWEAAGKEDDARVLPELDQDDRTDFCALVAFNNVWCARKAEIYIVPSWEVELALKKAHAHYNAHPRRRGEGPRKRCKSRAIRLDGEDRDHNIMFGFREKWSQYRDAWHLLEG